MNLTLKPRTPETQATHQQALPQQAPTPAAILQAKQLQIPAVGMCPAFKCNLQLHAGQLTTIQCDDRERSGALVDGLLGLTHQTGSVFFRQRNWAEMKPQQALQARREIGRVQTRGNWMQTCSVMENILLPLKHHSVVPENVLRASASDLARRFGLPGLPQDLPTDCPPADLARSACIRAFLGRPALVCLEYPLQAPQSDFTSALVHSIEQLRRRGGTVLWITDDEQTIRDTGINAEQRFRLIGSQLLDLERTHASP